MILEICLGLNFYNYDKKFLCVNSKELEKNIKKSWILEKKGEARMPLKLGFSHSFLLPIVTYQVK